ncbi:MAG TPA: Do family serine endopeptidase, partial [Roseiarcus sp.]|nr:Do family serine endopeptidase [Roseiarcus sp.]
DPIFRHFFAEQGGPARVAQSLGSGVIVDRSGLIVTNNHVIEGMTDVKVALADHREFEAKILLRDRRSDLAVLKIKDGGDDFPVLELGDSDAIEVGDFVLAIGNPFGVGQTVTQGIVSATARTQIGANDYGFFIQTDAAINPGNSGGALVDLDGKLIGINSEIISRSGGNMGLGFAIPVNMVKSVIAAAKGGSRLVRRPWLGASLQNVTQDIAESLGLDKAVGALVAGVVDGGPADEAGLKRGDIVVAVDGVEVDDSGGVGFRLGVKPLGGEAKLGVIRGGKKIELALRLTAAPETPPRDPVKIKTRSPFQGATLVNISPAVIEDMSLENAAKGVVVAEVEEGSTAAQVGVQKGDIVIAINGQKIETTRDAERASAARVNYWRLVIQRGGQVIQTVIGG